MSKVKIPFRPFFREKMLSGVKSCTARPKLMGKSGDTFIAFGKRFEILIVEHVRLEKVISKWHSEGCESREDFIKVWNSIHPRKPYDPKTMVWLHWFGRINDERG